MVANRRVRKTRYQGVLFVAQGNLCMSLGSPGSGLFVSAPAHIIFFIMFTCSWCKKEDISPSVWSEFKEPICKKCEYKYRTGLEYELFDGKVADLSKEQRREISSYLNNLERFVQVVRSVSREELEGKFKWFSYMIISLFTVLFLVLFYLINREDFWAILFVFVYFFPSYFLYQRIKWWLQFYQMKRKAQKRGFTFNIQ